MNYHYLSENFSSLTFPDVNDRMDFSLTLNPEESFPQSNEDYHQKEKKKQERKTKKREIINCVMIKIQENILEIC